MKSFSFSALGQSTCSSTNVGTIFATNGMSIAPNISGETSDAGKEPSFSDYVPTAVPAATSLALALELNLKVLYFQCHGEYPATHKLINIISALPTAIKNLLDTNYIELFNRDTGLKITHLHISFIPLGEGQSKIIVPNVSNFDLAIEYATSSYVKWRYLYEYLDTPEDCLIHFKSLLCLVESVMFVIEKFQGTTQLKLGDC